MRDDHEVRLPRIPPAGNAICEHGVFRNLCGQPHDDHSASRNVDTLQRDAPHLLEPEDGEGLVADVTAALNLRRQNGGDLVAEHDVGAALRAAGVKPLARHDLERILELTQLDRLIDAVDKMAEIRAIARRLLA
jgi:hypothetical protein